MLEGKAAVFLSYAEAWKSKVAIPFREFLASLDLYGVLVGEEPLPEAAGDWDPEAKVDYFLDRCDMFVALATPDLESGNGKSQTRPNIIDEIRSARQRPHLRGRMQIFKTPTVELPSNINPTYDALDPDDIDAAFPIFERQARSFGILKPQLPESSPQGTSAPSDIVVGDREDSQATHQAVESLHQLAGLLQGGDCSDIGATAARAHLASSTILASHRSAENLGVHELNGLYRERRGVTPTAAETMFLFRAVVANLGADNAPGWYWLRDCSASEIRGRLVELASSDADNATRREALELLAHSPDSPTPGELRTVVKAALEDGDESLGSKGLAVLENHGTRRDLKALESSLENYADAKRIRQARLVVVAKEAPGTALRQAMENPGALSSSSETVLLERAGKLPYSIISQALDSPSSAIRELALRVLNSTSKLRKKDIVQVISQDQEPSVRALAGELAVKRRWHLTKEQLHAAWDENKWGFDRETKLKVSYWATRSTRDLLSRLDWFDFESTYIYEALARHHFDEIESRLSQDLENDFIELKEESLMRLTQSYREAVRKDAEKRWDEAAVQARREELDKKAGIATAKILDRRKSTERFVLRRFRAAALAGLAEHGSERHLSLARRFVKSEDRELVMSSIELIRRVGDEADVPILLEAAKNSWGDIQELAAEAAVNLSNEPIDVALELLDMDEQRVVAPALKALERASWSQSFDPVWELLRDESPTVREEAAAYFITRLDALQDLPEVYTRGQYYYNVVARIDRHLYAPDWVRQAAKKILGS